jgi:hypothetical protein
LSGKEGQDVIQVEDTEQMAGTAIAYSRGIGKGE